ncbi:hypothetical protein ATANTOWER_007331 [Ataeniobius toweri]|uniref:Uncharacterized protein n=1 Tax=Ataeniobius toweri TaxID=208326 RepID=A0ABU7CFM9_9TELE|nr:hypothetical protein [Ataeniobius toweri]
MAVATFSRSVSKAPKILNLQECLTAEDHKYLTKVSKFVDDNRYQPLSLKNPPGSMLKIATLEDTIYRDKPDEVNGWGMYYLPEMVNMEVLGVVEGPSCPSDELVLMTCEDRRLYAYDGEELHVVAPSLLQLENGEIVYPSKESYYNGQAFEDMTEEDWAEVKKGDVGKALDQEHKKLVMVYLKKTLSKCIVFIIIQTQQNPILLRVPALS